jgi:hypothetical protein
MTFKVLKLIINTPINLLVRKIIFRLKQGISIWQEKIISSIIDIRTKKLSSLEFINLIAAKKIDYSLSVKTQKHIINRYLSHEFDYLGSSWLCFSRSGYQFNNINNVVNENLRTSHRKYSSKILTEIDNSYQLIDWQLDVKSGYKWSSKKHWSESLKVIHKGQGIDIKNPWEVGRLHHLGQMGILAHNNKKYRIQLLYEFRNQVLDFHAFNPVNIGVQWACTMDVSIRAANLIMSYSIFEQTNREGILDDKFMNYFKSLIFSHGKYIFNHLEKQPNFTNNHYFSNICGLLFISCSMKNATTDKWLIFGINEFLLEFDKQFNSDGSNFEASTAYHCLVSEMVLYTTALLLGLKSKVLDKIKNHRFIKVENNQIVFSQDFENKISNIFNFTKHIISPSGNIIQIGDNDSGRFFNFTPDWQYDFSTKKIGENSLNKKSILAGFNSLFNQKDLKFINNAEFNIVKSLSNGRSLNLLPNNYQLEKKIENNIKLPELYFLNSKIYDKVSSDISIKETKTYHFKDFGLIIWKNNSFWMSLYFGEVGQCANGGHSHNDKLSINLFMNSYPIAVDPGTYNYTAYPKERNRFRSYLSHPQAVNISSYNPEFSGHNLFSFSEKFESHILLLDNNKAKIVIKKNKQIFLREVSVEKHGISFSTKSNFDFIIGTGLKEYSSGYGNKE